MVRFHNAAILIPRLRWLGTITEHGMYCDYGWGEYSSNDPRSWRNEIDKTMFLSEFLDEMKSKYLKLDRIPYWYHRRPTMFIPNPKAMMKRV